MTRKHHLLAGVAMTAAEQRAGRFLRAPDGHPAATPATTPAPEPTPDDAFAAAFEEHATEVPAGDPAPAVAGEDQAPAAPAEGEGTPAPKAGETAPADGGEAPPAAPGEGQPAPEGEQKPPVTPPAEGQPDPDDILNRLAGLIKDTKPEAPAAPAGEPASELPPERPIYTQDEMSQLEEYEKNWGDVSRGETLKRRAEYRDMINYMFGEVAEALKPMQEQLRAIGNNLHVGELKAAVPDYSENLEVAVAAWVDTQPAYLQTAYKQVMQSGTSEEVADLIGRYRDATGSAPAAPAPAGQPAPVPAAAAPAAPAAKPATELSSAAIQAADSLAPVSGDRSVVPQGEDKGDFDTAFARHVTALMADN